MTFRLPTEAEWEYAARGGNKSRGYKYSGSNTREDISWVYGDMHPVGQKKPNELGLFDMGSSMVMEWCFDWYWKYDSSAQTNPIGPSMGTHRVLRGFSYRVARRSCNFSGYYVGCGMRLALEV